MTNYMLFERLFMQMKVFRKATIHGEETGYAYSFGDRDKPAGYESNGIPFEMFFKPLNLHKAGSRFRGVRLAEDLLLSSVTYLDPGTINCCLSTLSAFYKEWERAKNAIFASTNTNVNCYLSDDVRKYFVINHGNPDNIRAWPPEFPKAAAYILSEPPLDLMVTDGGECELSNNNKSNMRRGDIAQIFWGTRTNDPVSLSGHAIFIHDVVIDHKQQVWFQMLSAQGKNDTKGVGVRGSILNKYDLSAEEQKNLYESGEWSRIAVPNDKPKRGTIIPEIHIGRFKRPFPCWPCTLPEIPGQTTNKSPDKIPLPPEILEDGGTTLHERKITDFTWKAGQNTDNECVESSTVEQYYNNAASAESGFYPISLARTWHGGIHLKPGTMQPIRAISDGVIVAARCPEDDKELAAAGVGKMHAEGSATLPSRGFVLIRHQVKIGEAGKDPKVFYSLYMHLTGNLGTQDLFRARWLWQSRQNPKKLKGYKNKLKTLLNSRNVVLLAYPVAAGEVIGFTAADYFHFEIFSEKDITDDDGDFRDHKPIDDPDDNLFADSKELFDKLNSQSDFGDRIKLLFSNYGVAKSGVVLQEEIAAFFKNGDDARMCRGLVTRHISEWSSKIKWDNLNDIAPAWGYYDAAAVNKLKEITKLYAWMSEEIAQKCMLPADHLLWHYHPLAFIDWLAKKVVKNEAKQLIQDVVSFLPNAGEQFNVETGEVKEPVKWKSKLPSGISELERDANEKMKPVKVNQKGPWTQYGQIVTERDGANTYQFIRINDEEPAHWVCIKANDKVRAIESE